MQHRTFCALSTYPHLPLPHFIRGLFTNFSTRRNKSLHTQSHLSFAGKNGLLYCCVFSSISLSVCLKLTVFNVVDVLAGLLSAVLIAVAFRHLATKPLFYFACFYFYFAIFSRHGYCRLAAGINTVREFQFRLQTSRGSPFQKSGVRRRKSLLALPLTGPLNKNFFR